MEKREVVVGDLTGKHDNPIGELVQLACRFPGEISLLSDGHRINAKSIMGVIAFNPAPGKCITVEAEETDALNAMEAFLLCEA